MKRWIRKNRETILQDRWLTLYADKCELPNGEMIGPFYVQKEKEWIHIIAVDANGLVLLVRQYRYAADLFASEWPGGIAEEGEDLLETAKRELLEETGYTATNWTKSSTLFANPARQTNRVHCFIARGLSNSGAQSLDASEQITVEFVSTEEVMRRIGSGDFCQALHVASFLLAAPSLKKTEGQP